MDEESHLPGPGRNDLLDSWLNRRQVLKRGVLIVAGAPALSAFMVACERNRRFDTRRPGGPTDTEGDNGMKSESVFHALQDGESEMIWFIGTLAKIKGDGTRTGESFGMVEFTHPPGFATPLHVHHNEDEAFYVLSGSMRGICGDELWEASSGAFVWLPKDIPHGYQVEGEDVLRTLALSLPAGFESFVREAGEPAQSSELPLPGPPDVDKLLAAATKYGQEILGPLVLDPDGSANPSPAAA